MVADEAPGWDAIVAVMEGLHGVQVPLHFADPTTLPGDDSIQGLSAYDAGDHWHLVTFGLSELWEKESDHPTLSGYGLEYTMRVRRTGEDQDLAWAVNLLSKLVDVAFDGRRFPAGHTLDPGGPITGDPSSRLRALAFVEDPQVTPFTTPFGSLAFVQLVGLTSEEFDAYKADRSTLDSMRASNPLLITDPTR